MYVAVIVPAYNVAPFIGDAIQSVLEQTWHHWTMIVIDDGSTDGTEAAARAFDDLRIRVVRQDNQGVSAARNLGLASFNRPYTPQADAFLFLDADDWLAPTALTHLVTTLEAHPEASAACGGYARVGGNGPPRLVPPPLEPNLLDGLLLHNRFANGGQLLIRRSAADAAGPFNPALSFGEDWEYWVRLALLGPIATLAGDAPVLFARERLGSACETRAFDPDAYGPALAAIYENPAVAERVGIRRLRKLRRRAEAEIAWSVGRELIRHGRFEEGRQWLSRSIRRTPSPKRMALALLSLFRLGSFRPYPTGT